MLDWIPVLLLAFAVNKMKRGLETQVSPNR